MGADYCCHFVMYLHAVHSAVILVGAVQSLVVFLVVVAVTMWYQRKLIKFAGLRVYYEDPLCCVL
jgi:hypothetical protein